jgi:hypothetical protein
MYACILKKLFFFKKDLLEESAFLKDKKLFLEVIRIMLREKLENQTPSPPLPIVG